LFRGTFLGGRDVAATEEGDGLQLNLHAQATRLVLVDEKSRGTG